MERIQCKKFNELIGIVIFQSCVIIGWLSLFVVLISSFGWTFFITNNGWTILLYVMSLILILLQVIEQVITPLVYYKHDKSAYFLIDKDSSKYTYKSNDTVITFHGDDIEEWSYHGHTIYFLSYEIIRLSNGRMIIFSNFIPLSHYVNVENIKRINRPILSYCFSWRLFCNKRKV